MTESHTSNPDTPRTYRAFISYRHADNTIEGRQWATWIHQMLETYEVPADLVGTKNNRGEEIPERIFPVFRDEEELPADADLASPIYKALDHSEYLVVICSPRAVQSIYVANEIAYFKKIGKSDHVLAMMIDGEPNASLDEGKQSSGFTTDDECFPKPLQFEIDSKGELTDTRAEPIAADFRIIDHATGKPSEGWTSPTAYREALKRDNTLSSREISDAVKAYAEQLKLMKLKIIAGVLGVSLGELTKRDQAYQLEKERKKRRILMGVMSVVGVLAVAAVIAAVVAGVQYQEANEQRSVAEDRERTASEQRDRAEKSEAATIEAFKVVEREKDLNQKQLVEMRNNYGLALIERSNRYSSDGNSFYAIMSLVRAVDFEGFGKENPESLLIDKTQINHLLNKPYLSRELWRSASHQNHEWGAVSVVHSLDGRVLATGGEDYIIRVWDTKTGDMLTELRGSVSPVWKLQFSKDGEKLYSLESLGKISVWDLGTSELIYTIDVPYPEKYTTLHVNLDNDEILSGGSDGVIYIHDAVTGEVKDKLKTGAVHITEITPLSHADQYVIGCADGTIMVIDLDKQEVVNQFKNSNAYVTSIKQMKDGNVIIASADGGIRVWDVNGTLQSLKFERLQMPVTHIQLMHDKKKLIAACNDSSIYVFHLNNGRVAHQLVGHFRPVVSLSLDPENETLVSAGLDGTVRAWDMKQFVEKHLVYGHSGDIHVIKLFHNSKRLLTASNDGSIGIMDRRTGKGIRRLTGHQAPLISIDISHDDKYIVSSSRDNYVALWDAVNYRTLHAWKAHDVPTTVVIFDPTGEMIATGGADGIIRIWDMKTLRLVKQIKGHEGPVYSLLWTKDGKYIVSAGHDKTVRLWDYDKAKELDQHTAHSDIVTCLTFNNEGNIVASGSNDSAIVFWEIPSGRILSKKSSPLIKGGISSISFTPDEQFISVTDGNVHTGVFSDETIGVKILNLSDNYTYTIVGHAGKVYTHLYDKNEDVIYTGSADNTLRSWTFKNNTVQLSTHEGRVTKHRVSRNNKYIVTSDNTGFLYVWDTSTWDLLKKVKAHNSEIQDIRIVNDNNVVSVTSDTSIKIWDLESLELLNEYKFDMSTSSIAVSPDQKELALATLEGILFIDYQSGEVINKLVAHNLGVVGIEYSSDGKHIATSDLGFLIFIWDRSTNEIVHKLKGHSSGIWRMRFANNNENLESQSFDGEFRIWDINKGKIHKIYNMSIQNDRDEVLKTNRVGKYDVTYKYNEVIIYLKADTNIDYHQYFKENAYKVNGLDVVSVPPVKNLYKSSPAINFR